MKKQVPHGVRGFIHPLSGSRELVCCPQSEGCFLSYLDLSGTQKVGFIVNHVHYQFVVLLFSLSAALWVFTKCMAVITAWLRKQGIQIYPYLDDWVVRSRTRSR